MTAQHPTGIRTQWFANGELSCCLVLTRTNDDGSGPNISFLCQQLANQVRSQLAEGIDLIPAQDSLTLVVSEYSQMQKVQATIEGCLVNILEKPPTWQPQTHTIPVCYDARLKTDIEELSLTLKLSYDEIIQRHLASEYQLDMLGFLPGFFYLSGLDDRLHISRKSTPSLSVPAGSVAIAEAMSGIYSLSSPGGWWVIGRTPMTLFNITQDPPVFINPLDIILFTEISYQEWLEYSND